MKTFAAYFLERVRMRHAMPQIVDHKSFLEDLKSNDISVKEKKIAARSLTASQSNFNQEKVDRIKEAGLSSLKPIVISKDNFVLDGHHRWLAAKQLKSDIKVCQIDLEYDDLFEFLKDKLYIEKKKINE